MDFEGSTFAGKLCWVRKNDATLNSFFVKSGTSFLNDGYGFESNSPITIYVKGSKGSVFTEGATLKLKGNQLARVSFDDNVTLINTTDDYTEVVLERGTYTFE